MDTPNSGPSPKVVRLIETYDLTEFGDELERQWTDEEDRKGLRALADDFNRRLLREVLTDAGASPIDGEVENLYRLLTDDRASSGAKAQARNRLARYDVDVEHLTSEFVSRQAIHTYLTKYRGVKAPERTTSKGEQRDRRSAAIQRLQSRLESMAESVLTDLRNAGRITLGDFTVIVTVRVHCSDCGTQRSIRDLLDADGCDCAAKGG